MIVLLSPAKTLDYNCKVPSHVSSSIPYFANEAWQLIEVLKKYSTKDLEQLMHISAKLALLNYNRFQAFNQEYNNSKPCIYVYNGDVYDGIKIDNYSIEQLEFVSQTIRIISGLYGLLKPFDLIQAYRLEMSAALATSKGKNLYEFWNDKITQKLNEESSKVIINLASQEYSNAIISNKLEKSLINVLFKEKVNNEYKIIGIHAKRARGIMANFIITNFIKNHEDIKEFSLDGYKYSSELSLQNEYIFVRD